MRRYIFVAIVLFAFVVPLTVLALTEGLYETTWDSRTVKNGKHVLEFIATDWAGNVSTSTVHVTVRNKGKR